MDYWKRRDKGGGGHREGLWPAARAVTASWLCLRQGNGFAGAQRGNLILKDYGGADEKCLN